MQKTITEPTCPKCGSHRIIRDIDAGEEVCGDCGLVLDHTLVDTGPEWRAFSWEETNSRSRTGGGLTPSLYDGGLSTNFSGRRDGTGKLLDSEALGRMSRLKMYDSRSRTADSQARNLSLAMVELDRMSALLHLPEVTKNESARIYRKALTEDMIRGRSIDSFIAACIYAACRLQGVPRSLKAITTESKRPHGDVARTYRLLVRLLGIKIPLDDSFKFVSGIAGKLKLKRATEERAIVILRDAKRLQGLRGKEPRGLAAAALYMACLEYEEKRTQKEVAQAAGTTEVTLRNRLRGLEEVLMAQPPEAPEVPLILADSP